MNFYKKFIIYVIFISLFVPFTCYALEIDLIKQKKSLDNRLKEKGFGDAEIKRLLSDERAALHPEIIGKKGKGINYLSRKYGLLSKASVRRGQRILRENMDMLNDIEKRYGVEKEVLIAIYRLETNFGLYTGTYRVFNSLLTLACIENRRSEWAEQELVNFLVLCRMSNKDPLSIKGSWAGAFGLCQFVPTSFIEYAVDGDSDGVIDLFNFYDAIASIANYLKSHGWVSGNRAKMKKAVWSYNHCDSYVKAVFIYSKATKTKQYS